MTPDLRGLNEVDSGNCFQELALALPELIVLLDPVSFKTRFVNHLPPGMERGDELMVDFAAFVPTEHLSSYQRLLKNTILTGRSQTLELETDGAIPGKGKAWYQCSASLIKNESGDPTHILVISKDISTQKLHDIEIHNKQEKLYAILNNTNDIILSIDRNLLLTEYNAVFGGMVEKGFGKINLAGTSVLDFTDPKQHNHLKSIYSKVFKGEVANDIERFETQSGQTVFNETSYHPIYNFEQEITGISIFSKNITERVLNEQKLKNTLKEREVLLAEIHHRIKNNLALVSSVLQLKEMNIDNPSAKEALSDSRKRIKSTALVDRVPLNEYLTELFNSLNSKSTILLELSGENPVFGLNKALPFGLMMHELMMNSFKHAFGENESAKIQIATQTREGMLSINYCDFGGLFPAHIDFNDTTSTGLMLIHTFIEQLEGSIQLTDKQPPRYHIQIPLF
jgi:PAS domain S-box-containing protein